MFLGSAVEAVGKAVAGGLTRGGVVAPAGGGEPLAIGAGRIDMDGYEDDMVFAQTAAPGIDPADALGERDVFKLGYQNLGIVAERLLPGKHIYDTIGFIIGLRRHASAGKRVGVWGNTRVSTRFAAFMCPRFSIVAAAGIFLRDLEKKGVCPFFDA